MQKTELLSSLTKVMLFEIINHLKYENQTILLKESPEYNAYEKDIAVVNLYFGDSTVFGIRQLSFLIYTHF